MIFPRHRALLCIASLAFGLASGSAAGQGKAPDFYAAVKRQPLTFFVAKGAPNACGPGCSEWIAAEGIIDLDAAQRFRDFLAALPRRDLPVFWNSTGGNARQSMLLGAILREHRMTVGVGRTLPEGCRNAVPIDEACRRVMQSKREHKARLATGGARCVSGCVYALLGGSVRQVAPDAQLGIHSARVLPSDLPSGAASRKEQIASVDALHSWLKFYAVRMGVDPALIAAAAKVSFDRVHYMSREEMTRFGIETRGFYETPWLPYQDNLQRRFVLKSVTQAKGANGKEFRTSSIQISCVGAGPAIALLYRRELPANEIGVPTVVRVAAGGSELVLGYATMGTTDQRSVMTSWEFLRGETAVPSLVVTEAFTPTGDAEGWSRVVKLSTSGLSKAVEELQQACKPKLLDAPAAKQLQLHPPVIGGGR